MLDKGFASGEKALVDALDNLLKYHSGFGCEICSAGFHSLKVENQVLKLELASNDIIVVLENLKKGTDVLDHMADITHLQLALACEAGQQLEVDAQRFLHKELIKIKLRVDKVNVKALKPEELKGDILNLANFYGLLNTSKYPFLLDMAPSSMANILNKTKDEKKATDTGKDAEVKAADVKEANKEAAATEPQTANKVANDVAVNPAEIKVDANVAANAKTNDEENSKAEVNNVRKLEGDKPSTVATPQDTNANVDSNANATAKIETAAKANPEPKDSGASAETKDVNNKDNAAAKVTSNQAEAEKVTETVGETMMSRFNNGLEVVHFFIEDDVFFNLVDKDPVVLKTGGVDIASNPMSDKIWKIDLSKIEAEKGNKEEITVAKDVASEENKPKRKVIWIVLGLLIVAAAIAGAAFVFLRR